MFEIMIKHKSNLYIKNIKKIVDPKLSTFILHYIFLFFTCFFGGRVKRDSTITLSKCDDDKCGFKLVIHRTQFSQLFIMHLKGKKHFFFAQIFFPPLS